MKLQMAFFFFASFFLSKTQGQNGLLFLENPSFEYESPTGIVRGQMPPGHQNCSFLPDGKPAGETPLLFSIDKKPSHGKTYTGLTVHDDFRWERVGIPLSAPMQAGHQYRFHIDLSRAGAFFGAGKINGQRVNFDQACKLRIWAGSSPCDRAELLAESGLVGNHYWQDYAFVLSPEKQHSHLIFEAFYETSLPFPYNGNLLLDNASPLIPIEQPDMPGGKRGESLSRRFVFVDSIFGGEVELTFFTKNEDMATDISEAVFSRGHDIEKALEKGAKKLKMAKWDKFTVNEDFRDILLFALSANRDTKGFFDVGRQPGMPLFWLITFCQLGRVPNQQEILKKLDRTGIRQIVVHRDSIFRLKQLDLQFEWEGLAKAHAMDEMAEVLTKNGCSMFKLVAGEMALANLEEHQYAFPFFEEGMAKTKMASLGQSAIVSSKAGEYLFEYEGTSYFDFFIPMRGRPVTERRLVTVKANSCKTAYAWSQAFVAAHTPELVTASKAHILQKWWSVE